MGVDHTRILGLEDSERVRTLEAQCPGVLSVVRFVVQSTVVATMDSGVSRSAGCGHEFLQGLGFDAAVELLIKEGIVEMDSKRVVLKLDDAETRDLRLTALEEQSPGVNTVLGMVKNIEESHGAPLSLDWLENQRLGAAVRALLDAGFVSVEEDELLGRVVKLKPQA